MPQPQRPRRFLRSHRRQIHPRPRQHRPRQDGALAAHRGQGFVKVRLRVSQAFCAWDTPTAHQEYVRKGTPTVFRDRRQSRRHRRRRDHRPRAHDVDRVPQEMGFARVTQWQQVSSVSTTPTHRHERVDLAMLIALQRPRLQHLWRLQRHRPRHPRQWLQHQPHDAQPALQGLAFAKAQMLRPVSSV